MPAIKAYKSKGKIIPVDEAKVGKAYKCPWTEDLFATKKGYVNHLVKLRETRMHKRAKQNIRDKKFAEFYNQPSLKGIVNWVNTNPEFFFDNGYRRAWEHDRERLLKARDEFWVKITYLDLTYSECVSNSHNAPRGKSTNWGRRDKNVPGGYPGFAGNIEFQMSHDIGFGSDLFRGTGINTGSGSGVGEHRYGFDVRLFLEDFPMLANAIDDDHLRYDKENLLEMIKNKHKPYMIPSFECGTARYFKR
jgi:hypothetical protein